MFGVTILGNNSAIPAYQRHPSAQLVSLPDLQILIDCGEGTQMQISRYKIRHSKIKYILISHLHGDHYFGLIGLLTSMGLMGREQGLTIFGPPQLWNIIELQLKVADTQLPYPIQFSPLTQEGNLVDHAKFSISCFECSHRIPCWGFIIREKKKPRKIDKAKLLAYEIPAAFYDQLTMGESYQTKNGEIIPNECLTTPNQMGRSYAYCGDSLYQEITAEKVKGVSLLYHETTFLQALSERAIARYHSTTLDAARIAQKAQVEKLIIGHFSSKYEDLAPFLLETQSEFPNTDLAIEGVSFLIKQAAD